MHLLRHIVTSRLLLVKLKYSKEKAPILWYGKQKKVFSMKTHDFYYDLPPELIAQEPLEPRDHSRLLALDRKTGKWEDTHFMSFPDSCALEIV